MYILPESIIYSSPIWLAVAAYFARMRATRYILFGTVILAALSVFLIVWLEADCGAGGWFSFSRNCGFTPAWMVDLLENPTLLGLFFLIRGLPYVVILALIVEIAGRWPSKSKATSLDSDKPLDRE